MLAGVQKVRDLAQTAESVRGFGITNPLLNRIVTVVLPAAELCLGVLLLLGTGWVLQTAGWLTVMLMAAFTVVVSRSVLKGSTQACFCFGAVSSEPMTGRTVARNVALLVLALVVALASYRAGGVRTVLFERPATEWLLGLALAALGGGGSYVIALLAKERRRLATVTLERDEALARPSAVELPEIPEATVVNAAGERIELPDLIQGRAKLAIVVAPGCSACKELAPAFEGWRESLAKELDLIVVGRGDFAETQAAYPGNEGFIYADEDGQMLSSLKIIGTPAAVLLGTNGLVAAGPAHGAEQIVELLTAVIQAISVNLMTGRAHQSMAPQVPGGEDTGEAYLPDPGFRIEDFQVVDEEGLQTSFAEAHAKYAQGADLPVIAWRNGCGFCNQIAGLMKQFSDRGEVLLLINEPVSTVREQGLMGPVLQTVDADASSVLGVMGTPSGYPVMDLAMQPGGGSGGGSVLRMLRDRAQMLGTLIDEQPADSHHDHSHHHDNDHGHHNNVLTVSAAVEPIS